MFGEVYLVLLPIRARADVRVSRVLGIRAKWGTYFKTATEYWVRCADPRVVDEDDRALA